MQAKAYIVTVERLNNSVNGNPRYEVLIRTDGDNYVRGKTASDYSFVYNMPLAVLTVFTASGMLQRVGKLFSQTSKGLDHDTSTNRSTHSRH